jgi:lipopolysaccharide export system ATP-binding protein
VRSSAFCRIQPTSGKVFLDEEEITGFPMYERARRGITYLPQEPSIFRKLTVAQNVLAILETLPLSRRERRERLGDLLSELGLQDKATQDAATLSGGERRRVEITRALVLSPAFMLLDEPFSGIDPLAVAEIQKTLHQLRERGIGIVVTDHNVRDTLTICDRAYIIKDGRIIREGGPWEIAEDPTVREIYLGQNFRL